MDLLIPDDDALYDALLARSDAHEGRVWVCVDTTGIFCRLTCPARKPLRRNCRFLPAISACIEAGYRPCKRCRPLEAQAHDPLVADLLSRLEAAPDHRWAEADLTALGHDPATVRRAFKRALGLTFLDLARATRLRHGAAVLARGGPVIEAQLEAGFDSPAAFRAAFARWLGIAPGCLSPDGPLRAATLDTPLGAMVAVCDDRALHLLEFAERRALGTELKRLWQQTRGGVGLGRTPITDRVEAALAAFFDGTDPRLDLPVVLHGTPFQQRVWRALQQIPAGQTTTYGALAAALDQPTAVRAVAQANGANQLALVVPCHRVLGADGALTGYGGGVWRKERLLAIERIHREGTTA